MPVLPHPPARTGALLIGALLLCGCASTSSDDWSSGIPDPGSAVITLENLSYDPPRLLGLVGDEHPAAESEDANLRRSGIKRVPADRMEVLLSELLKRGFVEHSQPTTTLEPADPATTLRRLVVTSGEARRAFTLPRRPAAAPAESFNEQARAVQAMFNEIVDFRLEGSAKSATHFYEVQQRLFDANRGRKKAAGGKP
jgi:hypothetical protein